MNAYGIPTQGIDSQHRIRGFHARYGPDFPYGKRHIERLPPSNIEAAAAVGTTTPEALAKLAAAGAKTRFSARKTHVDPAPAQSCLFERESGPGSEKVAPLPAEITRATNACKPDLQETNSAAPRLATDVVDHKTTAP
jgi:hypothetical protein